MSSDGAVHATGRHWRRLPAASVLAFASWVLPVVPVSASMHNDFLSAADQGQCIENVVFHVIQQRGVRQAGSVVHAALMAQAQRTAQQRSLGCSGDIAAQAIAAGADPEQVLKATAAGL